MTSPDLSSIARGVPDADLLRTLAAANRSALERMISIAIDALDEIDPDPDLEPNGDLEGHCDEEGISTAFYMADIMQGPGCLISDDDFDQCGTARL